MNYQASFYMSNLENEIRGMQKLEYDLVTDKDLRSLAVLPQMLDYYEMNRAILSIQSKLFTLKNSSSYIKDVRVHIPSIGKTISGLDGLSDIDANEFKTLESLPSYSVFPVSYKNGILYVYTTYPVQEPTAKETPMAEIVIKLSSEDIKEGLQLFKDYADSCTLLISQSDEFMISNDFNTERSEQFKNIILDYMKENIRDTKSVVINKKKYLQIYFESKYLGMTLSAYIAEDQVFSNLGTYKLWFIFFTIAVVIIIVIFCLSTYRFIHKPLVKLAETFLKLEKGDMDIAIEHNHADEFRYIYRRFNVMVENLKLLIDQVYKQKILAQNAEMKQLQSQISPHFLYNSFFIMHRMIDSEDYKNALKLSNYLGDYFRFITRSAEEEIDLHSEVHHARMYAEIQIMRFSKQINCVQFDELPAEYNNLQVPRLIIQPLIENAFEHGLKDIERGGILYVRFSRFDDSLCIVVEDNGQCISNSEIENIQKKLDILNENFERTGLVNIHRRLQLRFGTDGGINLALSELGGLKIMLNIPLRKETGNV